MEASNETLISQLLAGLKADIMMSMLSKCKPNWVRGPFIPAYSKIYYIISGEGTMNIGGQELFPGPGQLVFAPAGLSQYFSITDPNNTYQMYWCHFTSNVSFMNLFSLCKFPYCLTLTDTGETMMTFERLIDGFQAKKGPANSVRNHAALLNLISCYIEHAVDAKPAVSSTLSNSKLSTLLHYIDANLFKEMSIAELAERVHHHPNYFIRFFKNHLGVTPMAYIYERRLEKAKQLIMSSDMTIGEVAQATGFSDIFHFSKAFKKRIGVTPTEFRSHYFEFPVTENEQELYPAKSKSRDVYGN